MARPARCLRCDDILDELTPDGSRVCWVCVIEWQAAEARMISDLGPSGMLFHPTPRAPNQHSDPGPFYGSA
jgi:hypothetical protein